MPKSQPLILAVSDSNAEICLTQGGRIKSLMLRGNKIIDSTPFAYPDFFASSILFPFVNRVKNGVYSYQADQFKLIPNAPPNAIHGLVFNEPFKLMSRADSADGSAVSLQLNQSKINSGFPFLYNFNVQYSISNSIFKFKISIENIDNRSFPFNIGWHPYFYTSSLDDSSLIMSPIEKYVVDENMIPVKSVKIESRAVTDFRNKRFDDGFKLLNGNVEFKTPDYHIRMSSTMDQNYLQLFTPDNRNYVAIEPMSGPADSFNSKIGLKELEPGANFEVEWKIELL